MNVFLQSVEVAANSPMYVKFEKKKKEKKKPNLFLIKSNLVVGRTLEKCDWRLPFS